MAQKRHRRGFQKEAESYANEFRMDLGLRGIDPICPHELSKHLDITLRPLSADQGVPIAVKAYFAGPGSSSFSATTVFDGPYAEILYNDVHSENRIRASIMHEIGHVILLHPPRPPISGDGCRHFDAQLEKEANDLGWTILVPKIAALHAVQMFPSTEEAAYFYGVSPQLLEYRIRKSDARRWASNISKKRGR